VQPACLWDRYRKWWNSIFPGAAVWTPIKAQAGIEMLFP
jgi:hypothetical protein